MHSKRSRSWFGELATPSGDVRVRDLRAGDVVWTTDADGKRVPAPVVRTSHVEAPRDHVVVHAGPLRASPGHPLCGAGTVADLSTSRETFGEGQTFDLLPAGPSGCYFADGVLVGSTLRPLPSR